MNFYFFIFRPTEQVNIKMQASSIAKPSWCICNNCCKMSKDVENVCCNQRDCRTQGEVFQKFYIDLLSAVLRSKTPRDMRRQSYEKTANLFIKEKWYPFESGRQYAPLPSCVLWMIRRKYPDPNNSYIGFPPKKEMLKEIVCANETFRKNMQKHLDVVSVAHPETGVLTSISKLGEENMTKLKEILPPDPESDAPSDDPYMVKPATDFLLQLALVANGAALEAFVEEMKLRCIDIVLSSATMSRNDFDEWLKSRLSSDEFIDKSDKQFFEDYLGDKITKVDRNDLLLKLYRKLNTDSSSQNAIFLIQMVLHFKKKQLRPKSTCKPTLHDLHETFVKMTEKAVLQSKENSMKKTKPKHSMSVQPRYRITSRYHLHHGHKHQTKGRTSKNKQNSPKAEIRNEVKCLITSIIAVQQESWQIWRQESGKTTVHEVRCTHYSGLARLSNLFYGIRSLFAHGTSEYTTQTGVLSKTHAPKQPSDFDVKISDPNEKTYCEEYLFSLWVEATEKGNQMNADYNLFRTMHSFYMYFAAVMCKLCACISVLVCDEWFLQKTSTSGGANMKEILNLLQTVKQTFSPKPCVISPLIKEEFVP